jgi:hypothetical protein
MGKKKMKDDLPTALFTHCIAHRLNLVLQNGSKNIKKFVFFSSASSIPCFVSSVCKPNL